MTPEELFEADEFEDLLTELLGVDRDYHQGDARIWSYHIETVKAKLRKFCGEQVLTDRNAIEEEREACAKVADSVRYSLVSGEAIAEAIRKRSEK